MGLVPAGIGTPGARKRACPVRGALDGNLPLRGGKALSFDPGEFITALFYQVDEQMRAMPKHPDAHLWPSEVVTLGLLEFISIKPLAATESGAPGSYAGHSRFPSRHRGRPPS